MRVWVRTDRLTGLGLTTGDIINAIKSQNVQAAVGRVGARPISDEQQLQLNIQTQGRLSSVGEFENIVVRTNPDGSVLRLSDVARVELGAANLDRETQFNGGPAAAVAMYQTPGANAIATLKAVRDRISELQKRFPEDLTWKVTYDPTSFVTATIEEVKKNAGRGIHPRGHRGLPIPRERARDVDTDARSPSQPDRDVHCAQGDRLLRQFGLASRARARHRHRGR